MTVKAMNEDNPDLEEIFKKFMLSDDKDEIDYSSCDIYDFPTSIFDLPIQQLKYLILDYNNLQRLPASINSLVSLIELSVNGNELECLPAEIGDLRNLNTLLMNENCLCNFPEEIGNLINLKRLSAVGNTLISLPNSFTNLKNLEEVFLDENELMYLPEEFGNLSHLQSLEICNNQLKYLPEDIGCACMLEVISCSGNLLEAIPESISMLRNLRFIDFSNNKLESLPDVMSEAYLLEKLFLENNNLKVLPRWFASLTNLVELTISDNALCKEPFDSMFCNNAAKLCKLDAGANFIASLPSNIGQLKNLEYLHLGSTISELERSNFQNGNWIKDLPESLCELTNLKKLNINENQISKLPDHFGRLQFLSYLDLGQNMLEYLPESFCRLVNLEYLQLSKNLLKKLPEDMGCLQKLIDLRLDNNLLKDVPLSIGDIISLQSLDLFHNELTEIPNIIAKLKNLKRLDLDQNAFKLNLAKVPKIIPGIKYPKRDPSLKDNWRGKSRVDKVAAGEVIEVKFDGNCSGEESEEEEETWNENALRMALQRGMSMWRSHTGAETRVAEPQKQPDKDDGDVDDNWVAYNLPSIQFNNKKREKLDPDEEDWDDEIEQDIMYQQTKITCHSRDSKSSALIDSFQNIVNRYPPSQQAFSTTACYDSLVYRKLKDKEMTTQVAPNYEEFLIVDGQFDDA